MKKPMTLYPFLFALFPASHLYFSNVKDMGAVFGEYALVSLFVLLFSLAVFHIVRLFFRNRDKAALITLIFFMIFFSYGHLLFFLGKKNVPWPFASNYFLMSVTIGIFVYGSFKLRKIEKKLENLTRTLNIATACLLALPLNNIFSGDFLYQARYKAEQDKIISQRVKEAEKISFIQPDILRDIYYIIPDRYASSKVLKEFYGFDNSAFIDALQKRGFYVAPDSSANYLCTRLSLASSLNMEYLDWLTSFIVNGHVNDEPLFRLIHDSKVSHFLKARGYKIINSSSSPWVTSKNRYADMNISRCTNRLSEFTAILFKTTILYPIHVKLPMRWKLFDISLKDIVYNGLQYQFMTLKNISKKDGTKFIFAHVIAPHRPYVFDKSGNFVKQSFISEDLVGTKYTDETVFLNKKILEIIDKILATSPVAPIIILQADEGPYPLGYRIAEADKFNWKDATAVELRERRGILNAYYLPGADYDKLYPSISPVNSFRLIFNLYFHTDFELLPDKTYMHKGISPIIYTFFDVADKK